MAQPARPDATATLPEWLAYIERVHPKSIDMGLERVVEVRSALNLEARFPVITVGGTNGKGSACAMLEAIFDEAGYRVGCYTSPHLLRYNERVHVSREEAPDADIIRALAAVDDARAEIALTYFEFSTLAAMWLFAKRSVDIAVLEVGLGGRLDAVNAFDADCALVMSVALDHMDYLGNTREAIGAEKSGIFRSGRPAICADRDPPHSLLDHAAATGARLLLIGRDFDGLADARQWRYWGPRGERHGLPHPGLRGDYQIFNAAAALAAVDELRQRVPVTANDIRTGLLTAENPGRFQVLPGRPTVILDVAHNPAAATALARNLARLPRGGRNFAVFAMLRDKDVGGVVDAVRPRIDEWLVSGIDEPRGADAAFLRDELARSGVTNHVYICETIVDAYRSACDRATQDDRIVVFGSFHTVAAVMAKKSGTDPGFKQD